MVITYSHGNKTKNRLMMMIFIFVFIIGGGVAAIVLTSNSPKEKYFLAEQQTFQTLHQSLKERYEEEINWNELTQKNPVEETMKIGVELPLPKGADNMNVMDPTLLFSNSTMEFTAQTDMENKRMYVDSLMNIAGMDIEAFQVYMNDEKINIDFPFMDETLKLKFEDVGSVLHQLDPTVFTGEETMDADDIFGTNYEEGKRYVTKYAQILYEELPEEAFTLSEEPIEIDGSTVDTEKIVFHLSETQIIEIVTTLFQKMKEDEAFKQWLNKELSSIFMSEKGESDIDAILQQWIDDVQNIQVPDGFTSTIWTENNMIVKRNMQLEIAPDTADYHYINIKGSQSWTKEEQVMDYVFNIGDALSTGEIQLNGQLSWKDKKAEDDINIVFGPYSFSYKGNEDQQDGKKGFARKFTFTEDGVSQTLSWEGSTLFEADRMEGEHLISLTDNETEQQYFGITIDQTGQKVAEVTLPSFEETIDIGEMEPDERLYFMETDFIQRFQQWIFETLAGGAL